MTVSNGKFYIRKITSRAGTMTPEFYYPLSGTRSFEAPNQKGQATINLPYTTDFSEGDKFGVFNDRDGSLWFKGVVAQPAIQDPENNRTTLQAYCTMHELSDVSVGNLGIFDFTDETPITLRRIKNFNGPEDDLIISQIPAFDDDGNQETAVGLPYTWNFEAGAYGNTDAIYIGAFVPFRSITINLSGFDVPSNDIGDLHLYIRQGTTSGAGWKFTPFTDTTAQLRNSGTISLTADISNQWVKSTQSNQYLFWARIQFYREGATNTGSVTLNSVSINQRTEVDDPIERIMDTVADWSVSGESVDEIYHEFKGESVVKALRLMASYSGGSFYNSSTLNTDSITWRPVVGPSLFGTFEEFQNTDTEAENYIVSLRKTYIPPTATRYTLYGAGHGDARITAELSNIGLQLGDGGSVWPTTGKGLSFVYYSDTNTLVSTGAESALGKEIHKELNVKQLSSLYSSGNSIEAANQLRKLGYRRLVAASLTDREEITIQVVNMTSVVEPGQQIRIDYRRTDADGNTTITNTDMIVMGVTVDYSSGIMTLECSPDGYQPDREGSPAEEESALEMVEDGVVYPQPIDIKQIEGFGDDSEEFEGVDVDNKLKLFSWDGIACVPARIFVDQFNVLDSEFQAWITSELITSDDVARWGYHYPGTGDPDAPHLIWTIDSTGTIVSREEQGDG